jgi:hypothetical protein
MRMLAIVAQKERTLIQTCWCYKLVLHISSTVWTFSVRMWLGEEVQSLDGMCDASFYHQYDQVLTLITASVCLTVLTYRNFLVAFSIIYKRMCGNIARWQYPRVCYRSPAPSQFLYLWACDCVTLERAIFLFSYYFCFYLQWNPSLMNLWGYGFSYSKLKFSLNEGYGESYD